MNNYSASPSNFLSTVSILLITFGIVMAVASRPVKKGSQSAVSVKAYDMPGIAIDPVIRDSFPCIYNLLQQLISEKNGGIFREPAFHEFFFDLSTRLVFSEKALPKDTGALSLRARFHDDGYFYDTIFLNRSLFEDMSQEYLVSVAIHESIHAYLSWCSVCYNTDHWLGVDDDYLKAHFRKDWDSLASNRYPNSRRQHILMIGNFIEIMTRALYLHTNSNSSPEQRTVVSEALTWAGLNDTPEWGQLGADTCRFLSIDIWSRNLNAARKNTAANTLPAVDLKGCRTTYGGFLDSLQLDPLCK